jgi:hypothetical protein
MAAESKIAAKTIFPFKTSKMKIILQIFFCCIFLISTTLIQQNFPKILKWRVHENGEFFNKFFEMLQFFSIISN